MDRLREYVLNDNNINTILLEEKIGIFREYFKQNVFNRVIHVSKTKINAEEDGYVILKSPEKLGGVYAASGDRDINIGNTDYVFASFDRMRTSLAAGNFEYEIRDKKDSFVVPMDIHDLSTLDDDDLILVIYSANILLFEDFQEFCILYLAILFDDPEKALAVMRYLHRSHIFDRAGIWEKVEGLQSNQYIDDPDSGGGYEIDLRSIMINIKKLLFEYYIVPPASPEIQYKDSVIATLVEKLIYWLKYCLIIYSNRSLFTR